MATDSRDNIWSNNLKREKDSLYPAINRAFMKQYYFHEYEAEAEGFKSLKKWLTGDYATPKVWHIPNSACYKHTIPMG